MQRYNVLDNETGKMIAIDATREAVLNAIRCADKTMEVCADDKTGEIIMATYDAIRFEIIERVMDENSVHYAIEDQYDQTRGATRLPLGKYKGRTLDDCTLPNGRIDWNYLDWLRGQAWFREKNIYLARQIDDFLEHLPDPNDRRIDDDRGGFTPADARKSGI